MVAEIPADTQFERPPPMVADVELAVIMLAHPPPIELYKPEEVLLQPPTMDERMPAELFLFPPPIDEHLPEAVFSQPPLIVVKF